MGNFVKNPTQKACADVDLESGTRATLPAEQSQESTGNPLGSQQRIRHSASGLLKMGRMGGASTSGTDDQKVEESSVAGEGSVQRSSSEEYENSRSSPDSELAAKTSDEDIPYSKDDGSPNVALVGMEPSAGSVENVARRRKNGLPQNGQNVDATTSQVGNDKRVPSPDLSQGGQTDPDRGGEMPGNLEQSEDHGDGGTRTGVQAVSGEVSINGGDLMGGSQTAVDETQAAVDETQVAMDESSENDKITGSVAGNLSSPSSQTEGSERAAEKMIAHVPGEPSEVVIDANALEPSGGEPTLHRNVQEQSVANAGSWVWDTDTSQGIEEDHDDMADLVLGQLADFIVTGVRHEGLFAHLDSVLQLGPGYNYIHSDA